MRNTHVVQHPRHLFAIVFASAAFVGLPVHAQKTAAEGIADYRASLQDGNPADLNAARGEQIWKTKRGPKNVSLEACDLGLGPGKVKGAVASLPRFFADAGKVMDVEARLVHCMVNQQGFEAKDFTAATIFSREGARPSAMEDIVAYVYDESRDVPIAVPQGHPQEKASYARGKEVFFFKGGPFDFSCASCHGEDNKRIRLQDLPNLNKAGPAQAAFSQWPAYRVSQGALRTMQWRVYDCFRQQRFPELQYISPASIDLITYMGVNANGGKMAAPAIKR